LPPAAEFQVGVGFCVKGVHVGLGFDFGLGVNDFVFVGGAHFCEPNLVAVVVPHAEVGVIFERTTIFHDEVVFRDNHFVHAGLPRELVEKSIGRQIREERIVEADRPGREVRGGLSFYRPSFSSKAPESPRQAIQRMEKNVQRKEINEDRSIERREIKDVSREDAAIRAADRATTRETVRDVKREESATKAADRAAERETVRNIKSEEAATRTAEKASDRQVTREEAATRAAEKATEPKTTREEAGTKAVGKEDKEYSTKSVRRTEADEKGASEVHKTRESEGRDKNDSGR
jgi:hypothetical protein